MTSSVTEEMDVKTALNNAEAKGLLELQIVLIDSKQQ